MRLDEDWEFNVLGVYNYRRPGTKRRWFEFVARHATRMEGDLVEAGVYRGRSLLATALLLREIGSGKKVYGYDTFSGFPPVYRAQDRPEAFDELLEKGRIAPEHHAKVRRLRELRAVSAPGSLSAASISQSGDFSGNARELLERKIRYLGLDNVVLVPGPFESTMRPGAGEPARVMAALLDCDLYESYRAALPFVWERLAPGGYVFLDEYYSLKFPGARIATDEFFAGRAEGPRRHRVEPGDFERWYVRKRRAGRRGAARTGDGARGRGHRKG